MRLRGSFDRRVLVIWACAAVAVGCAAGSRPLEQRGVSGPVTWEILDLRQRVAPDGSEIRWYYTLVLKETAGKAIQFARLKLAWQGFEVITGAREQPFQRKLAANGELRLHYWENLYLLDRSTSTRDLGRRPGGRTGMTVSRLYSGTDEAGRPIAVDVRLQLDPGLGTRLPPPSPPGPLPPARTLEAADLEGLAGRWRGYYQDSKGFAIPLDVTVRRDGTFEAAEDEPVTSRWRGTLGVRDGQVAYSQRNDSGTLVLYEGSGKRILTGTFGGRRDPPADQPAASAYTETYWLWLEGPLPQAAAVRPPDPAPSPSTPAAAAPPAVASPAPPVPAPVAAAGSVARSEPAVKVIYRVHGTAGSVAVTYRNALGGTEQSRVRLPWEVSFDVKRGGFLYISAQNVGVEGWLTCEISLDGDVRARSTSSGAYVIAECSGPAEQP